MIIPDVNLLVYAHDSTSPRHDAARRWWEALMNGDGRVGLTWIALLGFVRITTHSRLLESACSAWGPNLFYNSPMEACVVVCRARKPPERRGKVLFIDAVRQVARERAQSFLTPEHQRRILAAYEVFGDEPGFASVAAQDDVLANDGNLSILRYVRRRTDADADTQSGGDLREAWTDFDAGSAAFWREVEDGVAMVERIAAENQSDG